VGNKEVDGKVVDGKVVYSKNVSSEKAGNKNVGGLSTDFILFLLLLSTKSYKKHFSIYF